MMIVLIGFVSYNCRARLKSNELILSTATTTTTKPNSKRDLFEFLIFFFAFVLNRFGFDENGNGATA